MDERRVIAALYVAKNGCYFGLPSVDPWDQERDARLYAGPWPVVAHPPCERWGRYWHGGPSAKVRRNKGDDGGCFAAALAAVRKWGGVLEHPAGSHAWASCRLKTPRRSGWSPADSVDGWTCRIEQGHYGHPARKATWLYAVGVELPALHWGRATGKRRLDEGWHSTEARRAARASGVPPLKRLSEDERIGTPLQFRDLLISIARTAAPVTYEPTDAELHEGAVAGCVDTYGKHDEV